MPDMQIVNGQPSSGTDMNSVISGLSSGKQLSDPEYRQAYGSALKGEEENREKIKNLPSTPPPDLKPQPQQKDYQTDPMHTFGSFAMAFSALGSAFTKLPLTNALNSGAAVLNAKNSQDWASYKDAMDKWKIDAENGWKRAEWDSNQVKDAYERLKGDDDALSHEMAMIAASTESPALKRQNEVLGIAEHKQNLEKGALELKKSAADTTALFDAQEGFINDWQDEQEKKTGIRPDDKQIPKDVFADTYHKAVMKMSEKNITSKEREDADSERLADIAGDKVRKAGGTEEQILAAKEKARGEAKTESSGFFTKEEEKQQEKLKPSISPAMASFAAGQVLAGDKSALSNYGRGEKATANLAAIHEQVQKQAEARGITGADLARINAEFAGFQSEQKAVGSRAGAVNYSAAEVDKLMPLAKKAVADLNLSGIPSLAKLKTYAESHVGDQRYQFAYDTLQELQNAYTSLLVRNGVRSDAAQNLAEGVINLNMGKNRLAGAFDAISQSKNAIMAAAPAARESIMREMVKQAGGKVSDIQTAPKEGYVQELIEHPEAADSFDKKFGEGAAEAILKGIPQ